MVMFEKKKNNKVGRLEFIRLGSLVGARIV